MAQGDNFHSVNLYSEMGVALGTAILLAIFLVFFPVTAGTLPAGLTATINGTVNFTFASDFEADTFSARNHGIAVNDSYLDVNTTYFLTLNITNFTIDIYNFTANSTTATNPTNFTAKMRNPGTRYNLKANGVFSQEVLADSSGNATWQYNTWTLTPARFLLAACLESWSYTQWSACSGGTQSRTGTDANACGTAYNISEVVKPCYTGTSGGGGGSGSFSQGAPSTKLLDFSFPGLRIMATVLYTLPEYQNITVSYPASISPLIPPAPGLPYVFMEITPTFNSSQYLTQAQIDFEVNKSWYSKNGIALGSTSLLRYDGRYWRSLPTIQTGEDIVAYSFAANTTSFSIFAITGIKSPKQTPTVAVLPTVTTTAPPAAVVVVAVPTRTGTPTIQPPSTRPASRFWRVLAIVLLAMLAVAVFYLKKSKPPPKPGTQVTIRGIVTSHGWNDFDVFDGTGFILVRSAKEFPPLASRVEVKGTFSRSGDQSYIAATSVRQI